MGWKVELPEKIGRKACRKCFPRMSEATWDYLFDTEKRNGLIECRVDGPDSLVYYNVEKLKQFLCMKGYYTPDDFSPVAASASGIWAGLQVRQHRLAG